MRNLDKCFAANLRRMRRRKGLSQQQLSELLCFSDKTISKWERAEGIPNIQVLYELAELFEVKIDELFAEETYYYLGIDGGGTKTGLMLADEHGTVLQHMQMDCCNPIDIGIDAATGILREGINQICRDIPRNQISVFAGIAGGTSSNYKEALKSFFGEFGFRAYDADSDIQNIIAAGLGDRDGVAMILGTGIVAFTQRDGIKQRFSGWGYLFDDGGSAYNIGRDGLVAYFEELSGMAPPTVMTRHFQEENPCTQDFLSALYEGGKKKIASYARVVFDAAKQQDAVAIDILNRNMKFAARVLETAAASMPGDRIPIVLAGGLTSEADTLVYLKKHLRHAERYDLQILKIEPVQGALLLARKLTGNGTV